MSRTAMVLALAVACLCCSVTAENAAGSNRRLLQNSNPATVIIASKPATPVENSSQVGTCCTCKCVIPSKPMPANPACPNCVGMPAPTYSTKLVCLPGANRNCEKDVCIRDMGSWQALYEC